MSRAVKESSIEFVFALTYGDGQSYEDAGFIYIGKHPLTGRHLWTRWSGDPEGHAGVSFCAVAEFELIRKQLPWNLRMVRHDPNAQIRYYERV